MENIDPLQILMSDDVRAIDRKKMAEFLRPFVLIDKSSQQIVLLPDFKKVSSNAEKIEIVLLASKVRALLLEIQDGLTQKEIIGLDAMPEGSVKATVKILFDSKKIKQDKQKKYSIPGYRVDELINKINK